MMVLIPFGLQSKQHHHDQASKISSRPVIRHGRKQLIHDMFTRTKTINETNQNLFSQLDTSLHRGIFAYVRLAFDNNVHFFFFLHFVTLSEF